MINTPLPKNRKLEDANVEVFEHCATQNVILAILLKINNKLNE